MLPFITAGNATFTLVSNKINKRYTYKIRRDKKNDNLFFVSVLFGQDNENDYRFIGFFYADSLELISSKKAHLPDDSPQFRMIKQYLDIISTKDELPHTCEFYPSGRCGRCGRTLTVPESIVDGIGPECRKYL